MTRTERVKRLAEYVILDLSNCAQVGRIKTMKRTGLNNSQVRKSCHDYPYFIAYRIIHGSAATDRKITEIFKECE